LLALLGIGAIAALLLYGFKKSANSESQAPKYEKLEDNIPIFEKTIKKPREISTGNIAPKTEEKKVNDDELNIEYKKPESNKDRKEIPETKEDEGKELENKEDKKKQDEEKKPDSKEDEEKKLEIKEDEEKKLETKEDEKKEDEKEEDENKEDEKREDEQKEDEKKEDEKEDDEKKKDEKKENEKEEDEKKENESKEVEDRKSGELEAETEDYQVSDLEEVKYIEIPPEEEEGNKEEIGPKTQTILLKVLEDCFMSLIKKVVNSNQLEYAKDFVHITKDGKSTWERTHFIFIIDCSGSMKGKRWEAVNIGLQACLKKLKPMKDNVVSAFTFDDKVNPVCHERPADKAVGIFKRLPFTARGTNYKRALEHGLKLITTSKTKGYMHCILFLSDGTGGYPRDVILQLKNMKEEKKNILFYTMACETDEEKDMIRMSETLSGEHYNISVAEAARIVFTSVLGL